MKLFYDNLIPFMPDAKIVDGNRVPDTKLQIVRQTVIYLADFQNDHNLISLYEAVNQFSLYAEMSVLDLILSLGDIEIPTMTIDESLDYVVTSLIKSYSPDNEVDVKKCSAILLSIAHMILQINRQAAREEANAPKEVEKDQKTEEITD